MAESTTPGGFVEFRESYLAENGLDSGNIGCVCLTKNLSYAAPHELEPQWLQCVHKTYPTIDPSRDKSPFPGLSSQRDTPEVAKPRATKCPEMFSGDTVRTFNPRAASNGRHLWVCV